jgi:hypothetical protein
MEDAIAKKIGYQQAFKAISIGLVIAYSIMASMAGRFWIFSVSYSTTLIFACVVLYIVGYLFGGITGKLIIVKKYSAIPVGIISGFVMIWTGTIMGGLVGFITGLLNGASIITSLDYILTPIILVTGYGFIPIYGIGVWYGLSIKRNRTNRISS